MEEEQKDAVERRHKAELEQQIRQRIETKESLTRQMEEGIEKRRQEAREDARYKEEVNRFIFFICDDKKAFSS